MNDGPKRIERSHKAAVMLAQRQRLVRVDRELPPVKLTLDDWEDLQGHVAAASNHHPNKKVSRALLAIFRRIQKEVFDRYNDEE